jgi:hypothetical protein
MHSKRLELTAGVFVAAVSCKKKKKKIQQIKKTNSEAPIIRSHAKNNTKASY